MKKINHLLFKTLVVSTLIFSLASCSNNEVASEVIDIEELLEEEEEKEEEEGGVNLLLLIILTQIQIKLFL